MDAYDSRLGLGGGGVVDLVDALLADGLVLRLVDLLARQVRLQQRTHPANAADRRVKTHASV